MRSGLLALALTLVAARSRADSSWLKRAEELLRRAAAERDRPGRYALAEEAQSIAERAQTDSPNDPEPRLVVARALAISDPLHPELCRPGACERAVSELLKARELDGGGAEAERIASELGIIYSRLGEYARALVEYDLALRLVEADRMPDAWDAPRKSILHGNSAETLMALGRLDAAIARYRRAAESALAGGLEWELAQWGLGVALDRDQQDEKARLAISLALSHDRNLRNLSDENVFFEPPGDKWYYLALGNEVAGMRERAVVAWRSYLAAQPGGRFVARARSHLERLEHQRGPSLDPLKAPVVVGPPARPRPVRMLDEVLEVLRGGEDDLRVCYASALRSNRRERGSLELALEVHPLGFVAPRPAVFASTLSSSELAECVQEVATHWRFSPLEAPENETLIVPIRFGASR